MVYIGGGGDCLWLWFWCWAVFDSFRTWGKRLATKRVGCLGSLIEYLFFTCRHPFPTTCEHQVSRHSGHMFPHSLLLNTTSFCRLILNIGKPETLCMIAESVEETHSHTQFQMPSSQGHLPREAVRGVSIAAILSVDIKSTTAQRRQRLCQAVLTWKSRRSRSWKNFVTNQQS